jgi:hypothetical protein
MERIIKTTDGKYLGTEFSSGFTFKDGFIFELQKTKVLSSTLTQYSNSNYTIITKKK